MTTLAMRLLKLSIVVAALSYLIGSGKLSPGVIALAPEAPGRLAAVAVLFVAALALGCMRWHALLHAADAPISMSEVLRLSCIGNLFNTLLMGGMGGDVVRVAYVVQKTNQRAGAVASIALDRLTGLVGLFACGGAAMLLAWSEIQSSAPLRMLALATFALLASVASATGASLIACHAGPRGVVRGAIVALGMTLLAAALLPAVPVAAFGVVGLIVVAGALAGAGTLWLAPGGAPYAWARDRLPLGRFVMSLVNSILMYARRPRVLLVAGAYSVGVQALCLYAMYLTSEALGLSISLRHIMFATPGAIIANALPVPMGGLGVGEASFASLLSLCSPTAEAARGGAMLFLAWRILNNLFSVLTGLPYYLVTGERERTSWRRSAECGAATERAHGPAATYLKST